MKNLAYDKKIHNNNKALLEEYDELNFEYNLMMSSRIYKMITAHFIFNFACYAVLRADVELILIIAFMNFIVSAFLFFRVSQPSLRSKDAGHRLREIAGEIGIEGYGKGKTEEEKHLKSITLAVKLWLVIIAIFWILLAIGIKVFDIKIN